MSTPQLPPNIKAQIETDAKAYSDKKDEDLNGKKYIHKKTIMFYAYQAGATAYAGKLQEAQQNEKFLATIKEELSKELDLVKQENEDLKQLIQELRSSQAGINNKMTSAMEVRDALRTRCEKMEQALEQLIAAIPKQTNDADWWPDELTEAVDEAKKATHKEDQGDYPKLTPEQMAERKEAIEWIRNPAAGMRWVKANEFKTDKPIYRPFRRKREEPDEEMEYDYGEIYVTEDNGKIFLDINNERSFEPQTFERWKAFEILDEGEEV